MDKQNRVSFSMRLRHDPQTPIGEVVRWLNSVDRKRAKKRVEEALIMAYLPYAKEKSNASQIEIERCCWETQDMLYKHGFCQRQALKVRQPNWQLDYSFPSLPVTVESGEQLTNNFELQNKKPLTELAHNSNVDAKKSTDPDKNIYQQIDGIFGDLD